MLSLDVLQASGAKSVKTGQNARFDEEFSANVTLVATFVRLHITANTLGPRQNHIGPLGGMRRGL